MEKIILLFLASVAGVLSQTDMAHKSFIFAKNYSLPVQLLYDGDGPSFQLTVCLRSCSNLTESVMLSLISGFQFNFLFLILGSGPDSNAGLVWVQGQKVDVYFPTDDKRKQRNICLSWDFQNGEMSLWVNGKISERRKYPKLVISYRNPNIFLGPGQIFLGGKPKLEVGEVTDVHVWDRVLTSQEIVDFHDKKGIAGNVLNWSALNYKRSDGDFTVGKFKCKVQCHQ
ncbi:C-reactive protein-like [Rana temporaria]|uniref:C-reactive protein-like n=1 Tax=Rana temporaria TaxID=8407 RepID=UPI001AACA8B0|nr:C-reactive protein-like [Rana temporaria]